MSDRVNWSCRLYIALLRIWIRETEVPESAQDIPLIKRLERAMYYTQERRNRKHNRTGGRLYDR